MNNKLSIISAVEEALNNFLITYDEHPGMVLLGPPEMIGLIEEMTELKYDMTPNSCQFSVCNMMVVPKITPGIDFQVSVELSQTLMPNTRRKFIAEHYN